MRRFIYILFVIFFSTYLYSQSIEKIIHTTEVKYSTRYGVSVFPSGLLVDEISDELIFLEDDYNKQISFSIIDRTVIEGPIIGGTSGLVYHKFDNFSIGYSDSGIFIQNGGKEIIKKYDTISNGIAFVLKKEGEYIIYYIDKAGQPGAIDTKGNLYTKTEAMTYLRIFDPVKYNTNRMQAERIGILDRFDEASVLIWDNRWFNSQNGYYLIQKSTREKTKDMIQYDNQGNAYQYKLFQIMSDNNLYNHLDIVCSSPDNKNIFYKDVTDFSSLNKMGDNFSIILFTGLGGNIYYYISGPEYTEVFRIRRIWGDPNFYAMAVNGYTEDEYGKYVDEVLPKMSKVDLRLLRNTIFALYGVHFKSEDLEKYFDKQVWYTDKGLSSSQVTLPAHRQKLVEMIQKLEK